ncbi:MAG: nucleotide exchange factor GrpE [candidate division SR1 bacterium]|nr:nucleotide exchange factor GrpE [candidate division SR1 bacterium]
MKKEEKKPVDDLEAKLEAAHHQQDDKIYQELEQKIIQLEKEKSELEEIAKRSQYEYINLKTDFDRYQRQIKESSHTMEIDSLVAVVKKFLPFIEDLRKSLENITDEHREDPLTKGVQMVYNKFLKTLEHLHIKSIESLGLVPDSFLHEPVSLEPVEDEQLKGKIIKEFERGFVYHKGDDIRVIIASKVIVGQ